MGSSLRPRQHRNGRARKHQRAPKDERGEEKPLNHDTDPETTQKRHVQKSKGKRGDGKQKTPWYNSEGDEDTRWGRGGTRWWEPL